MSTLGKIIPDSPRQKGIAIPATWLHVNENTSPGIMIQLPDWTVSSK
jgi:hypothetical protein